MRAENAVVTVGIGVDPHCHLVSKILGNVGDETVLAHDDDDIVGREEKTVELVTVDTGAAAIRWNRLVDEAHGVLEELVGFLVARHLLAPFFQEETRLGMGAVPFDQVLQRRLAADQDEARLLDFLHRCPVLLGAVHIAEQFLNGFAHQVRRQVEMLDVGEVFRQLLHGEAEVNA